MIIVITIALVGIIGWGIPALLNPKAVGDAIAPDPASYKDAVVQVYAADVWGFRGRFAVHTWIATKAPHANSYTIYHVLGWRKLRGQSVVSIDEGVPNQEWFGSEPTLLLEQRGEKARELVGQIDVAAKQYPFPNEYTMWPGPNSNSFIEWIALNVPGLNLSLPAKALGKNWMKKTIRVSQTAGGIMIVVSVEVILEDGQLDVDGVRDAFQKMDEETRKEDGCMRYVSSVDVNDNSIVRIEEVWESMESLVPHFKNTTHCGISGRSICTKDKVHGSQGVRG